MAAGRGHCWSPPPVPSSRIKRNASGDELVRCAVDAATAYENILNAIKAAEDAADKATTASEAALQVGICHDTFSQHTLEMTHFSVFFLCAQGIEKNKAYFRSEFVI